MADKQELDIVFKQYTERMNEVTELSSPSLDAVEDADDYSRLLLYNFKKIGEIAGENREMIERVLMPLIQKEEPLSEEEIDALEGLNDLLLDMTVGNPTDIDSHLAELTNERVERERCREDEVEMAEDKTSEDAWIRALDKNLEIYCHKMTDYLRSYNYEEAKRVQTQGLKCYQNILSYLDKERYAKLSADSKKLVLVNVSFGANLYDYFDEKKMIEQLAYAREVMTDPFYLEGVKDWNCKKQIFRTYEYVAEMCYFDEYKYLETYRAAYEQACKLEQIWLEEPEVYEDVMNRDTLTTLCLYGAVRTQDPSLEKRLSEAVKLYEERNATDYSYNGIASNLETAAMLFDVIEIARKNFRQGFSEDYLRLHRRIPYDFIAYVYRIKNINLSDWFLAAVGNFVDAFRETPGGMKGGELFQKVIVALHPPTYVHSHMVAKLSLCLVRHALERDPELFVGFPGCGSVEEVKAKKDEILEYACQSALYHDMGKLMILSTIAMYGRRLLDSEFLQLKTHPDNGARIAERLPSLKSYADVIRGHHLWYDGSHGYPMEFQASESPYKAIIDVVVAADSLDAATDTVGRSYNKGKTFDEYKDEVRQGAGTRYAPWLPALLDDLTVDADVRNLLGEGRKQIYRDTFRALKEISLMRK